MKYIVTFDHPYYPEVYYFEDLEPAIQKRDELVRKHHVDGADCEGKIAVASVIDLKNVRTEY